MEGQETLMAPDEYIPESTRKRGSAGYKNLPSYDVLAGTGDNTRYIDFIMKARELPKIDKGDPQQVKERIDWYFNYCAENDMRPTVSGMAGAIGVTRKQIWSWKNGIDRPQNYPVIEEAYNRLEELWEIYMMSGRINPPCGIFMGKNHFDYKDVQDVYLTPNNPLGDTISAEEIEQKYAELPEE